MHIRHIIPLFALVVFAGVGCSSEPLKKPPQAEIYARGEAEFEEAFFFKPAEDNPNELTFKLAPLLLLEVSAGSNGLDCSPDFGALIFSNATAGVALSDPIVYVDSDIVTVRGERHHRLTYLWFYPVHHGPRAALNATAQGVRITLNAANEPVLWEVLADSSRSELVFVARSLEDAAAAEFGAPLEGRRHSVEAPRAQAPATIVARVIDDAPALMGPIVYLRRNTGDVMTLICRCMNSQAKKLAGLSTYKLEPWPRLLPKPARAGFWPATETETQLDRRLRLPAKF